MLPVPQLSFFGSPEVVWSPLHSPHDSARPRSLPWKLWSQFEPGSALSSISGSVTSRVGSRIQSVSQELSRSVPDQTDILGPMHNNRQYPYHLNEKSHQNMHMTSSKLKTLQELQDRRSSWVAPWGGDWKVDSIFKSEVLGKRNRIGLPQEQVPPSMP
ncbi:hypothetical protein Hypma_015064 [Hypsizygus marmoreus]|uniref:Uncharacterized protein n=1 Tax=Hypsizygus marmoreus TaxID=39966 RepID=A0A369KBE3_HYPMA|nr:hypothetical protein Hypma_015064 [Hypsizygus marmoreus]